MFSRANSLIAGQPAGFRFPGISLSVSVMYVPITVGVRLSKIQYEIYARLTNLDLLDLSIQPERPGTGVQWSSSQCKMYR